MINFLPMFYSYFDFFFSGRFSHLDFTPTIGSKISKRLLSTTSFWEVKLGLRKHAGHYGHDISPTILSEVWIQCKYQINDRVTLAVRTEMVHRFQIMLSPLIKKVSSKLQYSLQLLIPGGFSYFSSMYRTAIHI